MMTHADQKEKAHLRGENTTSTPPQPPCQLSTRAKLLADPGFTKGRIYPS